MLYLYGILFILTIYVFFLIFLRIRHPYWSKQPVYHRHKLRYMFYKPGILNREPVEKDRYVDLNSIQFHTFEKMETVGRLSNFLKSHYKNSTDLLFVPSSGDISDYHSAVKHNAHISFLRYKQISYGPTSAMVETNEIDIGTMTTRPVNISISKKNVSVQLVDLLCVHPLYRTSYQVPKIIQTHRYLLEKKEGTGQIYLVKNEDNHSLGIIPFCQSKSHVFDMFTWNPPYKLGQEKMLEISDLSSDILIDTVMSSKFQHKIYFDPFTLMKLIKSGNIHVYCLKVMDKVLGMYIFKRTCSCYKGDDIFECISTIKYCATELFIRGFHTASYMCYKKNRYRYLVIDGVSDNSIVVKRILRSKMCMHTYVVSYYFYNYITASVLPHDLLILI